MSYILEALRKSERERQAGQATPLASIPLDQAPPRHPSLAWVAVFLALLHGAVLGYLWFTRSGPNEPVEQFTASGAVERTAETTPVGNAAAARPAFPSSDSSRKEIPTPAKAESSALVQTEQSPAKLRLDQKTDQKTGAITDTPTISPKPSRPKPEPPRSTASSPAQVAEKWPNNPPERPRPPVDHEPASGAAMSGNDRPSVASQGPVAAPEHRDLPAPDFADEPAIPFLYAMPADFQQRVGPITINVFAYSEQPEERFAIIDMKKYQVGDRIQGGAELLEIRADSLVLQSEGRKFRVPRP